jgi:3-hydroxyisobutyrate dehydrogenase-like beta-hydroxyacid dehydrogenase
MKLSNNKVGIVGVGTMGQPMGRRLLDAGYDLYPMDIDPERVQDLISHGAVAPKTYAELTNECDIIILSLPNSQVVEAVMYAPGNLIDSLRPQSIVIDMGTSAPASTMRIAEDLVKNDIEMLDAPVSGGEAGAIKGTLSCMVGGSKEVLEIVTPILKILASQITYIGTNGMGHTMKLINNMVGISNLVILCEALAMAERLGVNLDVAKRVMSGGSAYSKAIDFWGDRLVSSDYSIPTYRFDLASKDVDLAQAMATNAQIPYPMFATTYQIFSAAKALNIDNMDICSIKTLWDMVQRDTYKENE